jgi:hypothetical protein
LCSLNKYCQKDFLLGSTVDQMRKLMFHLYVYHSILLATLQLLSIISSTNIYFN